MMNTTNTLAQRQMMIHPAIDAELRRMAQEAEDAFYSNDGDDYAYYEVPADLAQHFGMDSNREHRYYLWLRQAPDAKTGLPHGAIYMVNVYGIIERHLCFYSHKAIRSLWITFMARENNHV